MIKTDKSAEFLQLNVNDQHVLLFLSQVEMVLPMVELQTVPDKDHKLKGILNYHGKAIPVYDLANLLELDSVKITLNTPLLLCVMNDKQIALVLKEVLHVIEIDQQLIQTASLCKMKPYVSGIYEAPGCNAWCLDLQKLLHYHDLSEES